MRIAAVLGFVFLICRLVIAHDLSMSTIQVVLNKNHVKVTVTSPISRLVHSEGKSEIAPVELDLAVRKRLRLRVDGTEFMPRETSVYGDEIADLVTWTATMPGEMRSCEVSDRLFPEDPNSRTLVTVFKSGNPSRKMLLTKQNSPLNLPKPTLSQFETHDRWQVGSQSVNHFIFLVALILGGGSVLQLLRVAAAFLISEFVCFSAIGILGAQPSGFWIDCAIAISILSVAVQNLVNTEDVKMRYFLAVGFGVFHGLGVHRELSQFSVASADVTIRALFHVLAQALAVVVAVYGTAWALRFRRQVTAEITRAVSVGLGIVGAYGLVSQFWPS